jgi:hypothetical protein
MRLLLLSGVFSVDEPAAKQNLRVFFVQVMTPSFLLSGQSSRRQALSLKKTQCGSYRRLFLDPSVPSERDVRWTNTRGFERSGSALQAVAAIAGIGCSAGNRPASF